jgi:hypothetical protein
MLVLAVRKSDAAHFPTVNVSRSLTTVDRVHGVHRDERVVEFQQSTVCTELQVATHIPYKLMPSNPYFIF